MTLHHRTKISTHPINICCWVRLGLPLVLAALALSACGKRGDLERPGPLWGDPAPAERTQSGS